GAKPHPTPLVESSAMAAVLPPDPTYRPILPQQAIEAGMPSAAQLETVVYAGQAHEQKLPDGRRKGYAIGDGTGVGKGTEISAIISDNWNHGRKKAIWITEKAALSNDAKRDLATFGLDGELFDFNPRQKGATGRLQGIGFVTYDGLRQDVVYDSNGNVQSTKRGQTNRLQEIIKWLGKDFDGVIVFDEAHNAANAMSVRKKRGKSKPSAKALAVVAFQNAMPNARIIYVSATMATEVHNLAFAERLGLWGEGTAFRNKESFVSQVSSGGLSVMEIIARDMKSLGVYIARSLSYEGVGNRRLEHKLSPDQIRKYNEFADAWQMVFSRVNDALVATNRAANGQKSSSVMSALYGAEQRFYNQVLTAMQMPTIVADAKRQLAAGNSVVFQLVNTNEAAQERAAEKQRKENNGEISAEDLDLSPRDILIDYVEHSFPTEQFVPKEDEDGNIQYVMLTDPQSGNPVENPAAVEAKEELLDKLRMMTMEGNPLDTIIEEFGADNVAEITGRGRRREAVQDENGETVMRFVNRSKQKGLAETDEFNAGKRRVLVFSQAGGTGRSFHADRRFGNQQKRIHYLVQAGWKADAALQGFGRTHRSNEAQPPEYVLASTDLRGHQRFITTVARRLAQLGSLTAGDRTTAGGGVFSEEDNLENRYALNSVHDLMESLYKSNRTRFNDICRQLGFIKPKMDKKTGDVTYVNTLIDPEDNTLDLGKLDVPTFLNRILNLRVDDQNRLFDDFMEIMRENIDLAKENGTFDPGLEKLQGHKIEELSRTELWNAGRGQGSTDIVEVGVSKKSRKMPFDTAQARMKRQAEGRDWTFARNVKSGKVFGVVSLAKTKTDASGVVHDQVRCFYPDGSTETLNADDVRFSGKRQNTERLLEDDAAAKWQKALDGIPELDTTKRYFVTGTLLPVWDRLGVDNPRIFRIAPTSGGASFLGMEVKANRLNDVLRRFGKVPQSVELTPDMVLNRIVKDGKKVALLKNGWELKRARVNGDWRIELTGPESRAELEKLAREELGTYERIGYVPRFFVPRTVEGLQTFLAAYPAMPEDGGIATVDVAAQYAAMQPSERATKFEKLMSTFDSASRGAWGHPSAASEVESAKNDLGMMISALPTDELRNTWAEWQRLDRGNDSDPIHVMRRMVADELRKRGEALPQGDINWFNRDIDALTDPLSSVAIHEVNAWRKARGLPEMPKSKRTPVEKIVKAGKYMASNADEMRRFIEVSARTPQNWTAVEVNAVAQRRIVLEQDYDDKTRLINVAEMNGNKEEAQRIREARDLVQDQIDLMDSAINKAKREWGLAGLARRFMLNRDGSFARFSGEMRSIVGRELTDDEKRGAWTLWNAYRDAQGKLDEATVTKTAELLKDIVAKHMAEEEKRHRQGTGKSLAEIEREYLYALDHIRVHANRAGGVLVGLPNGRKWLDAIRRYHMARAIETGRKLTVDEMLSAIHEDIDGMVVADDHDIMQMTTGHGNTYEADNSELEKALREQRRLMNEYQKWEDMMEEGHLPDKTGLIRDEPTQEEREAQRTTREMMREFMQQHPELLAMDASKRLKTIQESLMKRWQNEIDDLQRAIEDGERIMRQKNTMTYTPEMEAKRRELEQKRQEYREAFPPEPLTHEQKVARIMRVLQARLAKLEEKRDALANAGTDAERAAILAKPKNDKVDDSRLDAMRDQIDEMKEDIEDLKTMHFPEGTPEEFTAMVA
ncbi:MAG: strawberry notch-like NTP hydrolase domain-containing protein, partial [Kiritimatiellia bacterium]